MAPGWLAALITAAADVIVCDTLVDLDHPDTTHVRRIPGRTVWNARSPVSIW